MENKLARSASAAVCAVCLVLSTVCPLFAASPDILGSVVSTDIVAYIDGTAIPSYNYRSNTMIVVEDLLGYGFDVVYDNSERSLRVKRSSDKPITADYTPTASAKPIGTPLMNVLKTDIVTYIEGQYVQSYNVGGMTVIPMDALAEIYPASYVWDADARTLSFDTRGLTWETEFMSAVAEAVAARETSVTLRLPTRDIDRLNEMLAIYDMNTTAWTHFAWVSRWVLSRPLTHITVSISYIADEATIAKVDELVNEIVAHAMTLPTDYDRIKYVHDTVCEMTTYDDSYIDEFDDPEVYKQNRYHIQGVILDGLAVCQGYTEAIDYILKKCGIECEVALNSWHSWNIVYLDGMGYHVDATWNDSNDTTSYRYFMRSTAEIIKTHEYEPGLHAEFTDDSLAWSRVNGCYFESGDFEPIAGLIIEAMRGGYDLELEFATAEAAAKFDEAAITDGEIFELLVDAGRNNQTIWYTYEKGSTFYILNFSALE